MDLNRATLIGRLTKDPETRTTPTGKTVTNFTVATSSVWTDAATKEKKEQTEFHNVVAWQRLGEIVAQYMKKGSQIFLEGRIQTHSYQAQDGTKKYRTEIIAENMIMLGGKGGAGGAGSEVRYEPSTDRPVARDMGSAEPQIKPASSSVDSEEISVEDIPF